MAKLLSLVLLGASLASAHFGLTYPEWRADTLENEDLYSQWEYPCKCCPLSILLPYKSVLLTTNPGAGVPADAGNRTDWPLTGGSLKLELHHKWTYVFVNLGLGDNVTNFNYTLTPSLWNSTGNGTLCLPSIPLPVNLQPVDGQKATIQVVTSGSTGSALYNVSLLSSLIDLEVPTLTIRQCADITFRASAKVLEDSQCVTSPGVTVAPVVQQVAGSTSGNTTANTTAGGNTGGTSAGAAMGVNMMALTSVAGLAVAFVFAMGC